MSRFIQDPINLDSKKIDIDETFCFKCNACGNCCRGRHNGIKGTEIVLSGPDVWRIMDYMNMTFEQILDKYLYILYDEELKLNVCTLRFKYSGSCAFLKKGGCTIYDARPRTCAIYPIGRAINFVQKKRELICTNDTYVLAQKEYNYECEYNEESRYTVQQWLEKNNVPLYDEEDVKWFNKLLKYMIKIDGKKQNKEEIETIFRDLYTR